MSLRPLAACFAALLLLLAVAAASSDARPPKPHRPPKPKPAKTTPPPAPVAAGPVVAENRLPGTPGWNGPPATGGAIEVYASATDARPGEMVDLHVATAPAASYRVLVYRLGWYGGAGARLVACLPRCEGGEQGQPQPTPAWDADGRVAARWPATDRLPVGTGWVTGYYAVRAELLSGPQQGRSDTTYFVVDDVRPDAHVLVQVPVNTWQAYNGWGGKSLYPFSSDGVRARRVSFDRPFDWLWPGAQGPLGWELPLVRFMERNGYDVGYQSDVATDARPGSLLGHRLDVVPGHSEYWTRRMRDGWDAARAAGVNLAFMGANAAYWQTVLEDGGRTLMSYKSSADPNPDPLAKTDLFRAIGRPECALIGIQHQGGNLAWADGDYAVAPDALRDPWFRGTGFTAGDAVRGIVSREVDSIPGTQSRESSCGQQLTVFFHRELGGDTRGNADATRYTTDRGSSVFAAGSLNFAWGLDGALADPRLQKFVDNAFAAMGAY